MLLAPEKSCLALSALSLSSHNVSPSQAQIFFVFWNKPDERAIMPQASLKHTLMLNITSIVSTEPQTQV